MSQKLSRARATNPNSRRGNNQDRRHGIPSGCDNRGLIERPASPARETKCDCCKRTLKNACFNQQVVLPFPVKLDTLRTAKRKERQEHLSEYLKAVNCMLNGKGGVILLHSEDHFLAFFDEQVDKRMLDLIPDGTMFDENFSRKKIDDCHHVVVVLNVNGRPVSLLEFNSMISLNKGREKPNYSQIKHLLTRKCPSSDTSSDANMILDNLEENQCCSFQEDSSRQAKVVKEEAVSKVGSTYDSRGIKLLRYCWDNLGLPTFIAAFAKQRNGGVYCIGLEEQRSNGSEKKWVEEVNKSEFLKSIGSTKKFWVDRNHSDNHVLMIADEKDVPMQQEDKTGKYLNRGVHLNDGDKTDFNEELLRCVKEKLLWYPALRTDEKYVLCKFTELKKASGEPNGSATGANPRRQAPKTRSQNKQDPSLYIVQIQIKHFPGVCFQTEDGPEAYCPQFPDNPEKADHMRLDAIECCQKIISH